MSERLRVYVCTDHDGHWPVGVASVVVASDEAQARCLLDAELCKERLHPHAKEPYTLSEISLDRPGAHILNNGDY